MYLPPPLTHYEFYILLALCRGDQHGFSIGATIFSDSLGSLNIPTGTLYPLLKSLLARDLIEQTVPLPAGKSGKNRMHYRITTEGSLRLQEEAKRLRHAVKTAEAAGVFADEIPPEIRRLLNNL